MHGLQPRYNAVVDSTGQQTNEHAVHLKFKKVTSAELQLDKATFFYHFLETLWNLCT